MADQKLKEHGYGLEGFAFGLADGIICLLGLIIGVGRATYDPRAVIITGIIGGITDAIGNSIGFYISQTTERGLQIHETEEHGIKTRIHSKREVFASGGFVFLATFAILTLLLFPFMFVEFVFACILAFLFGTTLAFALGYYVGRLAGENPCKSGFKYACLTIIGALASYTIGGLLGIYLT
jgi:predicted membrane protein (TIGR00267 family)